MLVKVVSQTTWLALLCLKSPLRLVRLAKRCRESRKYPAGWLELLYQQLSILHTLTTTIFNTTTNTTTTIFNTTTNTTTTSYITINWATFAYILKVRIAGFIIPQKIWTFRKFLQKCHKMAKNDPKWPRVAQIWPKMAQIWPKMIQSGPEMTQNGPQLPPNGPKMTPGFTHFFPQIVLTEKAVLQTFFAFRMYEPLLTFSD